MLAGFVEQVAFPLYPDEQLCWICHEHENAAAAIACSRAAGFAPVGEVLDDGKPSVLLVHQRTLRAAL